MVMVIPPAVPLLTPSRSHWISRGGTWEPGPTNGVGGRHWECEGAHLCAGSCGAGAGLLSRGPAIHTRSHSQFTPPAVHPGYPACRRAARRGVNQSIYVRRAGRWASQGQDQNEARTHTWAHGSSWNLSTAWPLCCWAVSRGARTCRAPTSPVFGTTSRHRPTWIPNFQRSLRLAAAVSSPLVALRPSHRHSQAPSRASERGRQRPQSSAVRVRRGSLCPDIQVRLQPCSGAARCVCSIPLPPPCALRARHRRRGFACLESLAPAPPPPHPPRCSPTHTCACHSRPLL